MKTSQSFLLAAVFALSVVSARADAPLRKGDQFDLRIGGVPAEEMSAISSNYTIDGEGCLNLPYINKVQVEGKTPSEVQSTIERLYINGGYFTRPTITVSIAAATRQITVGGEVNNKGRVTYTPDMTIMSAIGAAGDFSIYANQSKVQLTHDGKVQYINCKHIRSHPAEDVKVYPGDMIQVPQSWY